jgi:hypothetical protein
MGCYIGAQRGFVIGGAARFYSKSLTLQRFSRPE